jgi:hypothetical protein
LKEGEGGKDMSLGRLKRNDIMFFFDMGCKCMKMHVCRCMKIHGYVKIFLFLFLRHAKMF